MKLEKHFERLLKKAVYADDVLLALIDYIMLNVNKYDLRDSNLLESILRQYHKNDKGFKNTGPIILNDNERELYQALKAKCGIYSSINFIGIKDYSYMLDQYLECDAGIVLEDGCIDRYKMGALRTFFVGLPIYDLENNELGRLSYVYDDVNDWYWWKILNYKGKRREIKTHWQVLKEQLESFKITK